MPVSNFDQAAVSTGTLQPNSNQTFTVFIAGAQTTGALKWQGILPFAGTITDVRAYLNTAPTGATFIVDLLKNAVSLYTTTANRPTVAISGNASTTLLPDTVAVAVGDRLSVSILQIGATIAGSDLTVAVTVKQATVA
jgi:hypothetical protein